MTQLSHWPPHFTFLGLFFLHVSESVFADELHDIDGRLGVGDGAAGLQQAAAAAGVYFYVLVAQQAVRFDRGHGVFVYLDAVADAQLHHRHLIFLIHGKAGHPADLHAQHLHRAAHFKARTPR